MLKSDPHSESYFLSLAEEQGMQGIHTEPLYVILDRKDKKKKAHATIHINLE